MNSDNLLLRNTTQISKRKKGKEKKKVRAKILQHNMLMLSGPIQTENKG